MDALCITYVNRNSTGCNGFAVAFFFLHVWNQRSNVEVSVVSLDQHTIQLCNAIS